MRRNTFINALSLCLILVAGSVAAKDAYLPLVENSSPSARIYIRENASWAEDFAAKELAKYVRKVSTANLAITQIPLNRDFPQTSVIVGKLSEKAIRSALEHFGVKLPSEETLKNEDAFLVCAKENVLILAGTSDRSTLYAVYDFLEKEAQIGFFRIAEYIPESPSLQVKYQYRIEKPHFKYRIFQTDSGTPVHYSTWVNSREDWERDVRYRIKKKLNPFYLPYGTSVDNEVLADFGIDLKDSGSGRAARMGDFIASQLRKMGASFLAQLAEAKVPPEFVKKYHKAKYLESTWVGIFKNQYIHPADPLFDRFVSSTIRHLNAKYGPMDSYRFSPYTEKVFGESQEDRKEIVTALARRMGEIVSREDPEANLSFDSWAFHNKQYWTRDMVNAFFNAFPRDTKLTILDFAANITPFYKETDYFWGKNWIYGFYYQEAPLNFICGDIGETIAIVRDLVSKQRNVVGIFMMPEVTEPNEVLAELGCRLAWDPYTTKKEFLDNYVLSRYGKGSFKAMRKFWEILAETIYGPFGSRSRSTVKGEKKWSADITAWHKYMRAPGTRSMRECEIFSSPVYVEEMHKREKVLPALKEAITIALGEADNQAGSLLYYQDMVEITRQFIAELFNQNFIRAEMAFATQDKEAFKKYSANALYCMDLQIQLHESVSTWPVFSFAAMASKGNSALGGNRSWGDISRWMAGWQQGKIVRHLADYFCMDKVESLKYYYQPRVQAYFEFLKREMEKGNNVLPNPQKPETTAVEDSFAFGNSIGYPSWELKGDLADIYADIGMRFATQKGWKLAKVGKLYSDNPIRATRRIMEDIKKRNLIQSAMEQEVLTKYEAKSQKKENLFLNPDFEKDIENWRAKSAKSTIVSLTRQTRDTNNNSTGALRLRIRAGNKPSVTHQAGLMGMLKKEIKKGTTFQLSFSAKSLSGSSTISFTRQGGGASVYVTKITKDWQRYDAIFPGSGVGYPIDTLLFSAISPQSEGLHSGTYPLADAEFLLDDLSVIELE